MFIIGTDASRTLGDPFLVLCIARGVLFQHNKFAGNRERHANHPYCFYNQESMKQTRIFYEILLRLRVLNKAIMKYWSENRSFTREAERHFLSIYQTYEYMENGAKGCIIHSYIALFNDHLSQGIPRLQMKEPRKVKVTHLCTDYVFVETYPPHKEMETHLRTYMEEEVEKTEIAEWLNAEHLLYWKFLTYK